MDDIFILGGLVLGLGAFAGAIFAIWRLIGKISSAITKSITRDYYDRIEVDKLVKGNCESFKSGMNGMESRWKTNLEKDFKTRDTLFKNIYFSKDEGIKLKTETKGIASDIKEIKSDVKSLLRINGIKMK